MPGRNGTGPLGASAMSGRGLGNCTGTMRAQRGLGCGYGLGRACGRGYARGVRLGGQPIALEARKDVLLREKELLKNRLDMLDKQLETL